VSLKSLWQTTSLQQVGTVGKSPLCLLCRAISQIPLQRLVADKLATSPSMVTRQTFIRDLVTNSVRACDSFL